MNYIYIYRIPTMNAEFWLVKGEVCKVIYTSVERDIHLEPRLKIKKDWTNLSLKIFTFTNLTEAKLLIVYSSIHEIKE